MTGEINRVPQGLLSLLDMKARGQNPRLLSSEAALSIEAFQLYGLQLRRRLRFNTAAIGVVGPQFPAAAVVPQNEVWLLLAQSLVISALGAGTTYTIAPIVRVQNDDGTSGEHLTNYPLTFTAGQYVNCGGILAQPLWLPPGSSMGITCQGVTLGVASAFQIFVDAVALPI
jgi:hypothetical protein